MNESVVSPERCDTICRVPAGAAAPDRVECLAHRADLVHLDQHRVSDPPTDRFVNEFGVGDKQVITDDLDAVAEAIGEHAPAVPVVFGEAVLDRPDRIPLHHLAVALDELVAGQRLARDRVRRRRGAELRRGGVERDCDAIPTWFITRGDDRVDKKR